MPRGPSVRPATRSVAAAAPAASISGSIESVKRYTKPHLIAAHESKVAAVVLALGDRFGADRRRTLSRAAWQRFATN